MARPLALLLGGFVALSAVVVPTTGQYHAAYSFTEHAEAGDLQRNHVLKEVNQAGGVLETRKRHAPVLLQLALAAASLAVVLVILQCFRQLLGESKLRNAGFLHRRLAAGGEDPCERPEGEDAEEEKDAEEAERDAEDAITVYIQRLEEARATKESVVKHMADQLPFPPTLTGLFAALGRGLARLSEAATSGVVLPPMGAALRRPSPSLIDLLRETATAYSLAARAAEGATRCLAEVAMARGSRPKLQEAMRVGVEAALLLNAERKTSDDFKSASAGPQDGARRAAEALRRAASSIGGATGDRAKDIARVLEEGTDDEQLLARLAEMMLKAEEISGTPISPASLELLQARIAQAQASAELERRAQQEEEAGEAEEELTAEDRELAERLRAEQQAEEELAAREEVVVAGTPIPPTEQQDEEELTAEDRELAERLREAQQDEEWI